MPEVRQTLSSTARGLALDLSQQLVASQVSNPHATHPVVLAQYMAHVEAVAPTPRLRGIPGISPPLRSFPFSPSFTLEITQEFSSRDSYALLRKHVGVPQESHAHATQTEVSSQACAQSKGFDVGMLYKSPPAMSTPADQAGLINPV
jgi:hypothetical protein